MTDSDVSRLRGTTAYALLGNIDLCCNPGTVTLSATADSPSPVAVIDESRSSTPVSPPWAPRSSDLRPADLRSPVALVDRIQAVDLATWQELAEIPFADQPWAITINPCGTLFVAQQSRAPLDMIIK